MAYGNKIVKTQFEKLCKMCCTEQDICDYFGVSHDTVVRWCHQEYDGTFHQVFKSLCGKGRARLRRIQWEQAESSPQMAIWLGKQYLNQTDRVENNNMERVEFVSDVPSLEGDIPVIEEEQEESEVE